MRWRYIHLSLVIGNVAHINTLNVFGCNILTRTRWSIPSGVNELTLTNLHSHPEFTWPPAEESASGQVRNKASYTISTARITSYFRSCVSPHVCHLRGLNHQKPRWYDANLSSLMANRSSLYNLRDKFIFISFQPVSSSNVALQNPDVLRFGWYRDNECQDRQPVWVWGQLH